MPRLTKSELALHRAWLSDWHTPADMAAYVSVITNAMGSADFFGQGGVEFLRDAWLAAEFARHRRLASESEQWPDFEARGGGVTERVECAEADIPGRRRSHPPCPISRAFGFSGKIGSADLGPARRNKDKGPGNTTLSLLMRQEALIMRWLAGD